MFQTQFQTETLQFCQKPEISGSQRINDHVAFEKSLIDVIVYFIMQFNICLAIEFLRNNSLSHIGLLQNLPIPNKKATKTFSNICNNAVLRYCAMSSNFRIALGIFYYRNYVSK